MHVLLAASEVVGFAKTGGLADVAGSLPSALARRGIGCSVILPLHAQARKAAVEPTDIRFMVPIGGWSVPARLWRSSLPDGVTAWLVENDHYFGRDAYPGHGIYQQSFPDGTRQDYGDNCERFAFFNRAVCEALPWLPRWPDAVHLNDWQAGLVPAYLKHVYPDRDRRYAATPTLFTIHNIAFQGRFGPWEMEKAGLPWRLFTHQGLEFHDRLNMLKAGIVYADRISTVSPTYAQEIQTPQYGNGLEGVLRANADRLTGIVNGVDYAVWDPIRDNRIESTYSADRLAGKAECKLALQIELGLEEREHAPLLAVVARLTEQKGVDLIGAVAPGILDRGWQLAVLGDGDPRYHRLFEELQRRYPARMGLKLGFDEGLAHRIEAGADLFLMPSAFEPSGLNQLYSLRYGTPPVVRRTGGLADTVTDTTPATLSDGTATGFVFEAHRPHDLWQTVERAAGLYLHYPEEWAKVMRNGMRQDWSWDRSAAEYEALFRELAQGRG